MIRFIRFWRSDPGTVESVRGVFVFVLTKVGPIGSGRVLGVVHESGALVRERERQVVVFVNVTRTATQFWLADEEDLLVLLVNVTGLHPAGGRDES
ncbi:MAG: hypothetical protein IH933_04170 [Euryarchaeota archaeon]|nr:hypothetical protein [Euryarchaeota archaeon]